MFVGRKIKSFKNKSFYIWEREIIQSSSATAHEILSQIYTLWGNIREQARRNFCVQREWEIEKRFLYIFYGRQFEDLCAARIYIKKSFSCVCIQRKEEILKVHCDNNRQHCTISHSRYYKFFTICWMMEMNREHSFYNCRCCCE